MKLLLDTHVLIWVLADARELSAGARAMIDAAERVFVSSASMWEIAIKAQLGKIVADSVQLHAKVLAAGFEPLPVTWEHALAVGGLPPLHRDPFDRMLVAQAVSEPLHLITHDALLSGYGPQVTVI